MSSLSLSRTPLRRLLAHSLTLRAGARTISSTPLTLDRKSFTRPGPPPLPAADQAEFDALIKANATIGASPAIVDDPQKGIDAANQQASSSTKADDLHKDVRRGPKPEFEGDVNPKTGERGGPKNDPFIAGDQDWQYAGRVTDF